tara:strand:+ start:239 stop:730 length:492 start_codon:yes stop_codon:yes gene_type:complete
MAKDKEPADVGFDIELLLPFQINQLSSRLAAQARRIIALHGDLTLPQWRIVRIVAAGVARNSTAVRKSSGIDKGQFSKTVNALVEQGYIITRPSAADQRQFEIALTDKGQAAHRRLAPDLEARQRHLMAALTPEQRAVIFPAIRALAEAAETIDFLDTPSTED